MFSSNCDHLKIYVDGKLVAEADPDREQFPHLRYAPFTVDLSKAVSSWGDLRVEGYIQRSEEHTSELQSRLHLVCRLLLEKKNNTIQAVHRPLLETTPPHCKKPSHHPPTTYQTCY